MMLDPSGTGAPAASLLDTAWTILEAANDLGDLTTVEACRRVIDASLRGAEPLPSDMAIIQQFFG